MAQQGENGWQSEKTLTECMRYMFENKIATDVIFEVGPPNGVTENIRAHKCVLIARSSVFETMFSSGMTECRNEPHATIRVEDIDPSIFKDLLLYIYSESVSVNFEIAFSLMYASKKYILPNLVRECGKCLSKGLNVSNVIYVLEKSSLFNEDELKSKCFEFIAQNANAVLTGITIRSALLHTMMTILQMDKMLVREVVIYKACLAWARHQILIQLSIENPTDQQIREMLGDLLYKIRFPTMQPTEFAEISEENDVLTAEEKASIYYFQITKKKGPHLMFPILPRVDREDRIDREISYLNCYKPPAVCKATFTKFRPSSFTGLFTKKI